MKNTVMEQEKTSWLYRDRVLYSRTLPHQEAEVSFLKKGSIWKKDMLANRRLLLALLHALTAVLTPIGGIVSRTLPMILML